MSLSSGANTVEGFVVSTTTTGPSTTSGLGAPGVQHCGGKAPHNLGCRRQEGHWGPSDPVFVSLGVQSSASPPTATSMATRSLPP